MPERIAPIQVNLADDHTFFREGVAGILEGYPEIELVDQAADGRQLLSLVEQHRPDVVLTDIQMGPMDGFEATRQILKRFCKVALIVTKVKMLLKHRDVHVTLPADRSVPPSPRFRRMRSVGGSRRQSNPSRLEIIPLRRIEG